MAAYRRVMTHVTSRLTAKYRDKLRNPTLGNRVWAIFSGVTMGWLLRLVTGGPTGDRGPPTVLEFLVINFSVCLVLLSNCYKGRERGQLAPSPLGTRSAGERCKLPQRGPRQSPGR